MRKGRHVVIHDVIHDDYEMGGPQTNQLSGRIFTHNLGDSPIVHYTTVITLVPRSKWAKENDLYFQVISA